MTRRLHARAGQKQCGAATLMALGMIACLPCMRAAAMRAGRRFPAPWRHTPEPKHHCHAHHGDEKVEPTFKGYSVFAKALHNVGSFLRHNPAMPHKRNVDHGRYFNSSQHWLLDLHNLLAFSYQRFMASNPEIRAQSGPVRSSCSYARVHVSRTSRWQTSL